MNTVKNNKILKKPELLNKLTYINIVLFERANIVKI